MNDPQRGRSPSAGQSTNPHAHTPSPHHAQSPFHSPSHNAAAASGLLGDQSGATSFSTANSSFGNAFDASQTSFTGAGGFNSTTASYSQQQPTFSQPGYLDSSLPEGLTASASYSQPTSNIFGDFGASNLNNQPLDPPLFQDLNPGNQFSDGSALDPSLSSSNLMNQMSTQGQTSPTPPHLLSPAMQRQASGSPH